MSLDILITLHPILGKKVAGHIFHLDARISVAVLHKTGGKKIGRQYETIPVAPPPQMFWQVEKTAQTQADNLNERRSIDNRLPQRVTSSIVRLPLSITAIFCLSQRSRQISQLCLACFRDNFQGQIERLCNLYHIALVLGLTKRSGGHSRTR